MLPSPNLRQGLLIKPRVCQYGKSLGRYGLGIPSPPSEDGIPGRSPCFSSVLGSTLQSSSSCVNTLRTESFPLSWFTNSLRHFCFGRKGLKYAIISWKFPTSGPCSHSTFMGLRDGPWKPQFPPASGLGWVPPTTYLSGRPSPRRDLSCVRAPGQSRDTFSDLCPVPRSLHPVSFHLSHISYVAESDFSRAGGCKEP